VCAEVEVPWLNFSQVSPLLHLRYNMATEPTFEKFCVSPKAGMLWQNFSRVSSYFYFTYKIALLNLAYLIALLKFLECQFPPKDGEIAL